MPSIQGEMHVFPSTSDPMNKSDQMDRKQFLAAARAKAKKHYRREFGDRSAYEAKAAKRARIDWDRMAKVERRRQARTQSLDSLHCELDVPGFLEGLASSDELRFILKQIGTLFERALHLRYIEDREVQETATRLGLSKQAARFTIQEALKACRSVPRR